jgi:hypothetical protein
MSLSIQYPKFKKYTQNLWVLLIMSTKVHCTPLLITTGLHLYPFKHRSTKWTNVPFYATIAISAWNSAITIKEISNAHELYKNVLLAIAHYLGDPLLKIM